jgi:hypothetical protein
VGTVNVNGRETRLPETEGEILMWISRGEHQPPSTFNAEVPPELDAVVKQATSVRPENRFANADELRRALAVFIPPEVHPELWLSLAMKEIFAPEQERVERRSAGRVGPPPARGRRPSRATGHAECELAQGGGFAARVASAAKMAVAGAHRGRGAAGPVRADLAASDRGQ